VDPNHKQPLSPEWTAPKTAAPRDDNRLPARNGQAQPATHSTDTAAPGQAPVGPLGVRTARPQPPSPLVPSSGAIGPRSVKAPLTREDLPPAPHAASGQLPPLPVEPRSGLPAANPSGPRKLLPTFTPLPGVRPPDPPLTQSVPAVPSPPPLPVTTEQERPQREVVVVVPARFTPGFTPAPTPGGNALSGRLPGSSAMSVPKAPLPVGPASGLVPGGGLSPLIRPASSVPKPPARGPVYRGLPEIVKIMGWIVLAMAFGLVVGGTAPTAFSRIAAVFQVQPGLLAWYCVRALGILAYLVLTGSILYGLLLSTKILDVIAHRPVSFALHKDLAIVALILGTLHGLLLTFDQSFNFTLVAILVPFQSPYAPVAVGIGQLTLYASAIVTASFYVRRRIGQKAWRLLHYITFLVFIGSSVHGITSGSDAGTPWAFWMYLLAVTATVFLTTYRIVVAVATRADEFDVTRITGTATLPASRGPLDRPGAKGGYPWPT